MSQGKCPQGKKLKAGKCVVDPKWKTKSKTEKAGKSSMRFATGQSNEARSDTSYVRTPVGEMMTIRHKKKGKKPTYEYKERAILSKWSKRDKSTAKKAGKILPSAKEIDKYYKTRKKKK